MKTPRSPLEKRKISYSTKTPKNGKAPAKKRNKNDEDREFDGNKMTPPSFSLQLTNREDKSTPKDPKVNEIKP
jgi:hypothetical protein